jgi:hypothetical protein
MPGVVSEKIQGVYWYWDYAPERYCLAQRAVVSTLITPLHLIPWGIQIYHRGFLDGVSADSLKFSRKDIVTAIKNAQQLKKLLN